MHLEHFDPPMTDPSGQLIYTFPGLVCLHRKHGVQVRKSSPTIMYLHACDPSRGGLTGTAESRAGVWRLVACFLQANSSKLIGEITKRQEMRILSGQVGNIRQWSRSEVRGGVHEDTLYDMGLHPDTRVCSNGLVYHALTSRI